MKNYFLVEFVNLIFYDSQINDDYCYNKYIEKLVFPGVVIRATYIECIEISLNII